MGSENIAIHLIAGGVAGTTGAVVTCPFEVVKTRLQSSVVTYAVTSPSPVHGFGEGIKNVYVPTHPTFTGQKGFSTCATLGTQSGHATATATANSNVRITSGLACVKHIIEHEGPRGFFKGLGPNLFGVAPSRAIYFCAYDRTKKVCNSVFTPETPIVHICSAAVAGFTASTLTNPIWFIKTRLQLDQSRNGSLTVSRCVKNVLQESGFRGFYKGITASYYGISETVINFVIYEHIKSKLRERRAYMRNGDGETLHIIDFVEYMGASTVSKTIATCLAYPHEVARTRLRQSGDKYKTFWQTLHVVLKEEGTRGLYRGLTTQLVRQVPNTAIMFGTYEYMVNICGRYFLQIDPEQDY